MTTFPPSPKHNPLSGILQTLGEDLTSKIQKSHVLLIGAGGIGCELLKNLALSGFRDVEVIDLDTIDVSNLNRQFLFRTHHVGQPKCVVACEVAKKMVPPPILGNEDSSSVRYVAHHGNVKDESFGVPFFKKFDVVLNALDNVDARRHVNRVCLSAGVTLVEAGTTGYLGQVTVINKEANVECYECQPKPTQKVYPICTIRSTPSMPVHTIVWGKELYKLLFGKTEESMLYEDPDADEPSTYMPILLEKKPTWNGNETDEVKKERVHQYAHDIIHALYQTEIIKQVKMDRYKTAKKEPSPLSSDMIQEGLASPTPPTKTPKYRDTTIWTPTESISEFLSCLQDVYLKSTPTLFEFDKDDSLSMRFVTATSNLRSHIFGITPLQSLHDAKGIAGNIIPAIATTNAIVAGLQILQLFYILSEEISKCKYIYCLRTSSRKGFYIQPTTLAEPNPRCFVCRNATLDLRLNCKAWSFSAFIQKIVKKHLGFVEPTILLGSNILYDEWEENDSGFYKKNLEKKLVDLPQGGIKDGAVLKIQDDYQDLEVDICVSDVKVVKEGGDEGEEEAFDINGEKPEVTNNKEKEPVTSEKNESEDDDDAVIVDDEIEVVTPPPTSKRVAEETPMDESRQSKKAKVEVTNDSERN